MLHSVYIVRFNKPGFGGILLEIALHLTVTMVTANSIKHLIRYFIIVNLKVLWKNESSLYFFTFINDCNRGTLENQIKQAFAEIKSLVWQPSPVINQMGQWKRHFITEFSMLLAMRRHTN